MQFFLSASSATSVKVKVPAIVIDAISFEESAGTLTLTWSKNTRMVQVQGPLDMLDRAKEQFYLTYCESRKVLRPPKGGERAASMLRCPARSDYLVSLENGSKSSRKRATFVPHDALHSEQSSNRSLQVGRVSLIGGQSGRVNLLSSWFMNWVLTRKLWKTST